MVTATRTAARDVTAEIAYLTRALKAPTLRESAGRLAERARAETWTHEEYLAACLQREVAARDAHGGEGRIRRFLAGASARSGETVDEGSKPWKCRLSPARLGSPGEPGNPRWEDQPPSTSVAS